MKDNVWFCDGVVSIDQELGIATYVLFELPRSRAETLQSAMERILPRWAELEELVKRVMRDQTAEDRQCAVRYVDELAHLFRGYDEVFLSKGLPRPAFCEGPIGKYKQGDIIEMESERVMLTPRRRAAK